MWSKRRFALITMLGAAVVTLGLAFTTSADAQAKKEGIPKIVHFDVTSAYMANRDLPGAQFRVFARGVIFVPEKTRVNTKVLLPFKSSWYTTDSYGPYPTGRNVEYHRNWTVDAKNWSGKTFSVTLLASSTTGTDTETFRVLLTRR